VSDLSAWAPWVAIAISVAGSLFSIFRGQSKDTSAKFEAIEEKLEKKASKEQVGLLAGKLDVVEDKVTIVQNDLKHLPDKDATHRLEIALGKMESELGRLAERMKPIASMADRMQEAILEKVMS
jgi:hypothetical protein